MTSTLESYIKIFEDEVPTELCKRILDEYVNSDEWVPAEVIDKETPVNENIRNCSCVYMSSPGVLKKK